MRSKVVVLAALLTATPLVRAQDADKPQPVYAQEISKTPDATSQTQPEPYQITVTLKITDHGKLTTDQTFTLAAATQGPGIEFASPSVRDGDRIPVRTGSNSSQFQYVDTGTDIDVEHLHPGVVIHRAQGPAFAHDAGAVDENVDGSELGLSVADERNALFGLDEIGRVEKDLLRTL